VIANGEIVVDEGRLLTIEEGKLVDEVQRVTEGIWDRIPENHYLSWTFDEVSPSH